MKKTIFTTAFLLSLISVFAQPEFQHQIIQASTIMQNSHYGRGVCINGDYAIVSALLDNHEGTLTEGGAAFIYHLEDGVWNFQFKLEAEDAQAKDHFGRSVFINDTHAIVGCTYSDDPDTYNGSAYIFVNNGDGTWSQQAKLLASDRRAMDRFGVTVGISGNYAIVGCYGADYSVDGTDYSNAGAAYIYEFDGVNWGNEVILHPSTPVQEQKFGWCVNIHGNTAIVGSYEDRHNNSDGVNGVAYIYQLSGGSWNETQLLSPSDVVDGQNFGYSVDLSDNYAIVGSMEDDDNGGASGSAYIFRNDGGTYIEEQKLTANNGAEGDNFGYSVGIDENQAIVGSWHTNNGNTNTGSAYVYARNQGVWTEFTQLVANDPGQQDQNGWFVSISGNYALTGATGWDADRSNLSVDHGTNEGAAYIFASADAGNPAPGLTSTTPTSNSTNVSVTENLTLVFDTDIVFSNSGAEILIARSRDNAEYARYSITGSTTNSDLVISGNSLVISNLSLEHGTNYYVQFISNPITDIEGTAFEGLNQTTDYTFTTESTAPIWSTNFPVLSNLNKNSITLSGQFEIEGDITTGDYYITLTAENGSSQQQIVNGQNGLNQPAIWTGTGQAVSNNVFVENIDISTLNSETEYFINIVAQNGEGLFTVVSSLSFTTLDTEAPQYIASYPNTTNISGQEVTLELMANENGTANYIVTLASTPSPSISNVLDGLDGNGNTPLIAGSVNFDSDVLSQTILTGLEYETDYSLYLVSGDISDNYIETTSPTQLSFTTLSLLESIPVAQITPEDGSVNVPTSQDITVEFNKTIYELGTGVIYNSTNIASIFSLKAINTGYNQNNTSNDPPPPPVVDVPFTATWNSATFTATILPDQTLNESQIYELSVFQVQDFEGNSSEEALSNFVTADESAPITNFFNPTNGTNDFAITASLIVTFNEAVWVNGHIVTNNDLIDLVSLSENLGEDIQLNATIDSTSRILTITPLERLNASTVYDLEIGIVSDELGHTQTSSAILSFETASANVWTGLGNTAIFTDNANWLSGYTANAGIIIQGNTSVATINENINADYIIIEALGKLTIENGAELTVVNQLVIESSTDGNGSLINNGTLNVNSDMCLIEQVIPSENNWYNISLPVASIKKSEISGIYEDLVRFDNQTGNYFNCTENEDLIPMKGYLIKGHETIKFKGQLNQGGQSTIVEYGYYNNGWNLVGNPYTSAIDWDLISESDKYNIENAYWIWLPSSQFGTYNGNSQIGVNLSGDASEIPSNQSFWVKAVSTGILEIDNYSQIHNTQSRFKSAGSSENQLSYLRFTGKNGEIKDETVIAFDNEALEGFDKFDSEKRFGQNINTIELFSIGTNNEELAINVLNELNNELSIPLGFKVQNEGEYYIELSEIANFESDVEVELEDKNTGSIVKMEIGDSYKFNTDMTKTHDRFILHLKSKSSTLGIESSSSELIKIYNSQRTVVISKANYKNNNYRIFDISGKTIASGSLESSEIRIAMENDGIYIVVVYDTHSKTTQKIVIE